MKLQTLLPAGILMATSITGFGQSGFYGRDVNGDGVVTRNEWRGSAQSFRLRDSNHDGVLSGDELPEAMRMNRNTPSMNRNTPSDVGMRSRTQAGGRAVDQLDKNNSGVVEGYEWPYNANVFHRLDTNGDSVLDSSELRNLSSSTLSDLDRNRNGRIDDNEWPGGFAQFERLDQNNDGRVTSDEYFNRGGEWQRRQRFDQWDRNRDGMIERGEWQSNAALFRRLDSNRDGRLDWTEFSASTERYDKPYGWR